MSELEEGAEERRSSLERLLRERWSAKDPEVVVSSRLRPDGKVDFTVISRLFEGKDGLEREAFFWPVFDPVPKSELIYLTYCLLLTPDEAARHFAEGAKPPSPPEDAWEE